MLSGYNYNNSLKNPSPKVGRPDTVLGQGRTLSKSTFFSGQWVATNTGSAKAGHRLLWLADSHLLCTVMVILGSKTWFWGELKLNQVYGTFQRNNIPLWIKITYVSQCLFGNFHACGGPAHLGNHLCNPVVNLWKYFDTSRWSTAVTTPVTLAILTSPSLGDPRSCHILAMRELKPGTVASVLIMVIGKYF